MPLKDTIEKSPNSKYFKIENLAGAKVEYGAMVY
jgi:hypothetical protein